MKICCVCRENQTRNKSSSYCKVCHNEYQKRYYKSHPRSINESTKRRKGEIRALIIQAKNVPCVDCGKEYPWYVMDFDHVRGKKKFDLSVAASKHRAIESILEEMAKCDIVCANCHRKRTFERLGNGVIGSTSDFESEDSRFES